MLIVRTALVELNFSAAAGQGSFKAFEDQQLMHDCKIIGVEGVSASQLSRSPSNQAMVSQSNCLYTALDLRTPTGTKQIYQIPFGNIITSVNAGIIKEFYGLDISWQTSGVWVFSGGIIAANESICFNFLYVRNKEWKQYLELRAKYGRVF